METALIVTHEELTQWVKAVAKSGILSLCFSFSNGAAHLAIVRKDGRQDEEQIDLLENLQKRLASLPTVADRRAFVNSLASRQIGYNHQQAEKAARKAAKRAARSHEWLRAGSMSDDTPVWGFQFISPTVH